MRAHKRTGKTEGHQSAEKALRESEALVKRQEVDLANLAQLSQYIVQHLRESILVIDTHPLMPAGSAVRTAIGSRRDDG